MHQNNDLTNIYNKVKEFYKVFNHPINESTPKRLDSDTLNFRVKLIQEEVDELKQATNLVDQVDALIDIMYFVIGSFVTIGVDPSNAFNIVHQANMKKVWSDGKPHYREDGKVIKPEGWESPEWEIEKDLISKGYNS